MHVRWNMVAIGIAVFGLGGCTAPPTTNDGGDGGGGDAEVPSTTKVLTEQTLDALTRVSEDQSTFTFSGDPAQVGGLEVGDIIVSGVHEPLLPYGALRRVDKVESTADGVELTTSFTGLAQAVEKGSIHTTLTLDEPDVSATAKDAVRMAGPGQLIFPVNNVVLYDGDKNPDTTGDQIVMNGNLTMDPDVVIDIDIDGFSLQKAAVEIVGDFSASISIEARREASFSYEDILLAVPFPKVFLQLGPVPVVLVPILELRAGAEGSFAAGMSTDLSLEADTEVGFGYQNGSFGPILSVDPDGTASFPSFQDGATAEGTVWISAEFKISVYGLAGVFVEAKTYGRASVDADACPWWDLYAGIAGTAGAYAGISAEFLIFDADITIFEWETDPLKKEKLLAEADGCASSAAQSGLDVINWARSYGGDSLDFPIGLSVTPDGGSIVSGQTAAFDAYVMKLDELGHISWQTGLDDLHAGLAIKVHADGYYLLAGERDESSFLIPPFIPEELADQAGDPPAYLLRLDSNGDVLWAKAIAAADALDGAAMGVLPDGSAVVAGTVGDAPDGQDVWVARFGADGAVHWSLRIGQAAVSEDAQSMIVDSSGDIVVLATGHGGDLCDWIVKLNADGDVQWQVCYDGAHNDFAGEVIEVPGGYMLVGTLDSHAQANRINYDGNLLWAIHIDSDILFDPDTGQEMMPDETPYDEAFAAAAYADGDVLVGGSRGLGAEQDYWVFRLNNEGSAEWMRAMGGDRDDAVGGFSEFSRLASTVAVTPDGGALIAGYSASFSHAASPEAFDIDTWIVRVRPLGTVDLDAESGATGVATGGEVDDGIQHVAGLINAVVQPFDLLVADFEPVIYTTAFDTTRQGGLE